MINMKKSHIVMQLDIKRMVSIVKLNKALMAHIVIQHKIHTCIRPKVLLPNDQWANTRAANNDHIL